MVLDKGLQVPHVTNYIVQHIIQYCTPIHVCIMLTTASRLDRIVRFLVAMNVLHEVDQNHFISTPFAATLGSSSPFSAAVIHR